VEYVERFTKTNCVDRAPGIAVRVRDYLKNGSSAKPFIGLAAGSVSRAAPISRRTSRGKERRSLLHEPSHTTERSAPFIGIKYTSICIQPHGTQTEVHRGAQCARSLEGRRCITIKRRCCRADHSIVTVSATPEAVGFRSWPFTLASRCSQQVSRHHLLTVEGAMRQVSLSVSISPSSFSATLVPGRSCA
jgi:hypothetical protein